MRGTHVNDEEFTQGGSQKAWSEETNWATSSDVVQVPAAGCC